MSGLCTLRNTRKRNRQVRIQETECSAVIKKVKHFSKIYRDGNTSERIKRCAKEELSVPALRA